MIDRFAQFPRDLASRARNVRFGPVPALLAHPDWTTPAPTVLWMHGRTVNKELDPGRYLRWVRAGIAACALDLPGHGERSDPTRQTPDHTLAVLAQMAAEIDLVVEGLADPALAGVFDLDRLGVGGMSAGGMATLRRLCDPHPFKAAAVEATTGWLAGLYFPDRLAREAPELAQSPTWAVDHDPHAVARVDPSHHLDGFRPIPLLALHSEADQVVPVATQRRFLEELRTRYAQAGADPAWIELRTWPRTGAPAEHNGFGIVSNDAKNLQTDFFRRVL